MIYKLRPIIVRYHFSIFIYRDGALENGLQELQPFIRVFEAFFQNSPDRIHCANCEQNFYLKNFINFLEVRIKLLDNKAAAYLFTF